MDLARKVFDSSYNLFKPFLFYATKKDPEWAHDLFVSFSKFLTLTKLEKFFLDNESNYKRLPFEISNAAGLDKNAEISPEFFRYLGFDRVVYGTFTEEKWEGNPRPRTKRIVKEKSLINNIGWENDGSKVISSRLRFHKNYEVPITISVGFTPDPTLSIEQKWRYLKKVFNQFNGKGIHCINRIEYNPSCPNLLISREENQKLLREIVPFIKSNLSPWQELNIKVSPDLDEREIDNFIKLTYDFTDGYVLTNTTKKHNYGNGSASGNILYALSLETQKKFYERLQNTSKKIIACGGIDSVEKIKERLEYGAKEIQIFTPLIFEGPGLLRDLRKIEF